MDLPEALISQAEEGRIVLLLGSGASLDCKDEDGNSPPSTRDLARLLATKFLSTTHISYDLMTVAELAISETSLPSVQDYIASLLTQFEPSRGHALLSTFRWHGLATTNYDRLVETAYDRNTERLQSIAPIISNEDNMNSALRGADRIALLKLHGCVSRTRDNKVPFILTPDQYVSHRKHRDNLFRSLKEWGSNNTLVAVGHSLRDPDLRQILLELGELGLTRPRYYLVGPDLTDVEERLWESRRISPLRGTFSDFLEALDTRVARNLSAPPSRSPHVHPISQHVIRTLRSDTMEYLARDADFVHAGLGVTGVDPADFYRGLSPEWAAIEQGLDVRRRLVDTVLYDVILKDEGNRQSLVEFVVIQAEAGAGKSICLQRIAWDAAVEANHICLYVRPNSYLNYEAIEDIGRAAGQRIFLFVDSAAENVPGLEVVLMRSRRDRLPITVISTERQNQWNIYCERLEPHLSEQFRLRYLNHDEIVQLIELLQRHGSLGYLEQRDHDERIAEFEERAGRQLLVALLEATHGRSHQDILVDEFERIVPERARSLYLTVCVLNRLDVPVRAGLISRVHGIPFSEFQNELFRPLEHVVRVREDRTIRDFVYVARHSLIAQVVFERILNNRNQRFDEYSRVIGSLNLAYETDTASFRRMIRGRVILSLFPSHDDASAIFDLAHHIAPDDVHVLHQRGIYEMQRPYGSLDAAHDLFSRASRLAPEDFTITHSFAELERKRAMLADNAIQRRKHENQAYRLAISLLDDAVQGSYGYHTILKIRIDQLRNVLDETPNVGSDVDVLIQEIEESIEVGLQRFPDDEYLLASEAEFATFISDDERARLALSRAFERNKRSPYIASRLATTLVGLDRIDDALEILETALSENSTDRRLHFSYAMMRRQASRDDADSMVHHLRHSFVPGDEKYHAQFWYGCYLYMKDTVESVGQSRVTFRSIWSARLPYRTRTRIRAHFTTSDGSNVSFTGVLRRREATYGWVVRDGVGDQVMIREQYLEGDIWSKLEEGAYVRFDIGFCFGGPVAVNLSKI